MSLELPSVTLCCVDTRFPGLAEFSLHRSIERTGINFGDVVLLTSKVHRDFPRKFDFPMRVVGIDEIGSKVDYSRFVLHDLARHVHTDHVLVTQWDSFVVDAEAWDPAFLEWDYIGAPWPGSDGTLRVGNGGFSLRSARLLREAGSVIGVVDENEDMLLCVRHRTALEASGLRFSDAATAGRFAYERVAPPGSTFGFHGLFNFGRVLPARELEAYVEVLPIELALSHEGGELAALVFNAGMHELGRSIVRRRLLATPGDGIGTELARQMWAAGDPCWCGSGKRHAACHAAQGAAGSGGGIGQTPAHERYNGDVLAMIPEGLARIVEVGSSSGALALAYRTKNPRTEYIGIEIEPGYVEQSARHCSRVLQGNIEQMSEAELAALAPDCWIFADVLEHLYDPWGLLLRMRRIMRPQDGIIACVPNVQHWSVQARLAGGNFWYEDMGLLDRTHIRFFTRLTLVKMFGDCGFRIVKGVPRIFPMENQDRAIAAIRAFAANLGLDVEACARDAAVFQYVLHAVPW